MIVEAGVQGTIAVINDVIVKEKKKKKKQYASFLMVEQQKKCFHECHKTVKKKKMTNIKECFAYL